MTSTTIKSNNGNNAKNSALGVSSALPFVLCAFTAELSNPTPLSAKKIVTNRPTAPPINDGNS